MSSPLYCGPKGSLVCKGQIHEANHSGKIFFNTLNSLTYPLHLFNIVRPQQWLGKVNSALCKWRKALKGGSTVRAQVFFTWSFSMVSIPTEGKELTLVSERSLERQTKSSDSFTWTQSRGSSCIQPQHVPQLQNKDII